MEPNERIAVLEAEVKAIHDTLRELKAMVEPMAGLYQAGKMVTWLTGILLTVSHWEDIVRFFTQKH